MTPSHVASLWRVMDVFLRGEETAHRNGTPNSPLRSGSMLYPCNNLRQTDREIKREKQARKTKKKSPNSTWKLILTLSSVMTNFKLQNRMKKGISSKSCIRKAGMYNGQRLTWLRIMTYLLHAKRRWWWLLCVCGNALWAVECVFLSH